eukprot:8660560-Alexandrium_andersonii.AAC.1
MEEVEVLPAGPQGETSLSGAWNRRNSRTPAIETLRTRGAARITALPVRSAETSGSAGSAVALDKGIPPCWPTWSTASDRRSDGLF